MNRSFLILHGWGGSGPGHWQAWLAERLRARGIEVRFPAFPAPDYPDLRKWLPALNEEMGTFRDRSVLTVICHSLAVLLWLHYLKDHDSRIADRVFFVAPPGPSANVSEVSTFFPPPLDRGSVARAARRTCLICSDADPYCTERAASFYGAALGLDCLLLPDEAAHINISSGFGPWPLIEELCLESESPLSG